MSDALPLAAEPTSAALDRFSTGLVALLAQRADRAPPVAALRFRRGRHAAISEARSIAR
jgi:hypothetical protein